MHVFVDQVCPANTLYYRMWGNTVNGNMCSCKQVCIAYKKVYMTIVPKC